MKDIYLTDKLKDYYTEALEEVSKTDNELWRLDDGVESYLRKINENEYVQTMYSNKGAKPTSIIGNYLVFAYKAEVEKLIFRELIPYFILNYNNLYENICFFMFEGPRIDTSKNGKETINLKCVKDANYFNINNVRITLKDATTSVEDEFWKDLADKLSTVSPLR